VPAGRRKSDPRFEREYLRGQSDELVEGSKILVGRLYEEVRGKDAFWVTEDLGFYRWSRELAQRGLSTARAVRLRHGRTTKVWSKETSSSPVRVIRQALRAAIAEKEERAWWSRLLKELLEAGDVVLASKAFDPLANRRLREAQHELLLRPLFGRMWRSFKGPVDAMPVDLFRVFVGVLSCAYFSRTFLEAPTFSSPQGLIDHGLVRKTLWYTRLGLFPAGAGLPFFRVVYTLAALASLLLAAGVGVKPTSAFLYATAVSTFRWNFPVAYVDDALMHLTLLWMLLLPIGHTLTLPEWLSERGAAVERWKQVQVPGAAVRCLLMNLALVYIVAGLWKWRSPLWRRGLAVYAVLKTAISRTPELWKPGHLPALVVANHSALVLEPLFPLAFVLPKNHPLKWSLGAAMIGFHAGIIATMRIPFANVACIAASVLVFSGEIMGWLRGPLAKPPRAASAGGAFDFPAQVASLLVGWLALAMLSEALRPLWRYGTPPAVRANKQLANRTPGMGQNPFYGVLWCAGLAQSYRLFDWIDHYNYYITYDVVQWRKDGSVDILDSEALFPRTIRSVLLQSYLHGATWMKIPRHRLADLQRSLFERYARRFCRECKEIGRIEVTANVQRTTPENLDLSHPQRMRFLSFTCKDGEPDIHFLRLTEE
jgi:hypothetical protein